jgi:hypothetical protein
LTQILVDSDFVTDFPLFLLGLREDLGVCHYENQVSKIMPDLPPLDSFLRKGQKNLEGYRMP